MKPAYPSTPLASTFANQPQVDFNVAANREAMQHALTQVASELGESYPLVIDGKPIETDQSLVSLNPSRYEQVVGHIAMAKAMKPRLHK